MAQWYSARLRAARTGVRVSAGYRNFSLHHRVQTGSGAHPASYPMGTGVFSPDHSPPYSAEIKNAWSYTSTPPISFHEVVLS
jgi:hypothetical protein